LSPSRSNPALSGAGNVLVIPNSSHEQKRARTSGVRATPERCRCGPPPSAARLDDAEPLEQIQRLIERVVAAHQRLPGGAAFAAARGRRRAGLRVLFRLRRDLLAVAVAQVARQVRL